MKGKILLLAIPLLFSCSNEKGNNPTPIIPPHSYEEISDRIVPWLNSFICQDGGYCVYYFSRTCGYCDSIKDEVIEVALTHEYMIYFCNDNNMRTDIESDPKETIGETDITQFVIRGVPTIIEVNQHVVKSHYSGRSETLKFIRSIH